MLNGKYSKVLTVVLVIAIVGIVGLLVFIGIDWYKVYTTGTRNNDFTKEFDDYINNVQDADQQNAEDNSVVELNIDANSMDDDTATGNGNGGFTYEKMRVIGKIEIPKTKLSCAVYEEATAEAISKGIGMLYGNGINKVGNTVLVGHNYRNGTFFSNNKKLENGDKIYLTDTSGKKVTYVIYKKYTTTTNDFDYAERDTKGKREISLSTCTDDSNNRLIIWAKEM